MKLELEDAAKKYEFDLEFSETAINEDNHCVTYMLTQGEESIEGELYACFDGKDYIDSSIYEPGVMDSWLWSMDARDAEPNYRPTPHEVYGTKGLL